MNTRISDAALEAASRAMYFAANPDDTESDYIEYSADEESEAAEVREWIRAALEAYEAHKAEQQGPDARAQFEAWAKDNGLSLETASYCTAEGKFRSGYLDCDDAWLAWQAALAARQPVGQNAEVAKVMDRCIRELRTFVGLAHDYDLEMSVAALETAIESMELRKSYAAPPAQAVDLVEQQDAARYRQLRRKVCIAGGEFHILNLHPTYVAPDAAAELDAVLDSKTDSKAVGVPAQAVDLGQFRHAVEDGIAWIGCLYATGQKTGTDMVSKRNEYRQLLTLIDRNAGVGNG